MVKKCRYHGRFSTKK